MHTLHQERKNHKLPDEELSRLLSAMYYAPGGFQGAQALKDRIGASLIDGHPRLRPWAGIGGRGSYVASLVNEPTLCKPNVVIRGSRLVVACPIVRGNELLVSYGPLYQRDYLVSRYVYSKQHYAALER